MTCTKCFCEKELDYFPDGKVYKNGKRKICKECVSAYNKIEWVKRMNDPVKREKVIESWSKVKRAKQNSEKRKEWLKNYRRKVLRQKPLKLRFSILEQYRFTCQYCGRKSPDVLLQIDHIIPSSKGGKYIKENLTVACADCNLGKGDILLQKTL